jgi:3-hexulose-6-phosphate synthase
MKLQIALDRLSKEECISILAETSPYVDWIEVGTGVIKQYGVSIIEDIKKQFPEKIIVSDMKTCDAGKHEAKQAFEAGADITTVMAYADNQTIIDMLAVAEKHNKRVMVDLLGVKNNTRVEELKALNVDLVSLHVGKDMQQNTQLHADVFDLVKGIEDLEVAIAGGINLASLEEVMAKGPNVLIVGSTITSAANPGDIAKQMKGMINRFENNH